MKITFQWAESSAHDKQQIEDKISSDLGTLLIEDIHVNIILNIRQPHEEQTGFITDATGKNLYTFIFSTSTDNNIKYNKFIEQQG